ncbi:MAG: TIGR02266 family protein, partial [Polyangiales bacterium]
MAEARKDKRTLLSLKIRYKSATLEDFIERYSSDISRGGVFIKAKKPLAVGTLLKFEFMLQDESTLIHGVGRVVWRREQADATADDPPGMGIKFIKMDSSSRAVVQKIADDRVYPGVFEQGKERERPPVADESLLLEDELEQEEQTQVRHVSEFLASALEEGGAGEVAQREAQAGAERARRSSEQNRGATAYGAFSAPQEVSSRQKQSLGEAQSRGAMSAFGGSAASTAARVTGSVAPALDDVDPDDDFLESETTKVHDYPAESYRPEAAATVIAKDAMSPLFAERRATPVVPAGDTTGHSFEDSVPDLFGPESPDSVGPAPGEIIDVKMFESDKPKGRAPVPEAPGIPSEAFKVPQAPEPVWTTRPTPEKKARPGLVIVLIAVTAFAGLGVLGWQLGFLDGVIAAIAPTESPSAKPARVAEPVAAPVIKPEEAAARAPGSQEALAEGAADEAQANAEAPAEAAPAEAAPSEAADTGMMKFEVISEPPGAFVSVNGKRAGRTPLEIEHEVGTKLSIYAKIRGSLGQRQKVEVVAGQEPVSFQFAPLPYVLEVVTSPAGAMASAVGGGVVTTPG